MHSNDFFLYITSFLSNARKKQELRRQYIVKLMVQKSVCTPLWRMVMRWRDFDESSVLNNDVKKKAVKKAQRTYLSFSVFLKCSFATFSNASKPYCFTNCFAHASTLFPAPFAKCIFHFASISSIFFKKA